MEKGLSSTGVVMVIESRQRTLTHSYYTQTRPKRASSTLCLSFALSACFGFCLPSTLSPCSCSLQHIAAFAPPQAHAMPANQPLPSPPATACDPEREKKRGGGLMAGELPCHFYCYCRFNSSYWLDPLASMLPRALSHRPPTLPCASATSRHACAREMGRVSCLSVFALSRMRQSQGLVKGNPVRCYVCDEA